MGGYVLFSNAQGNCLQLMLGVICIYMDFAILDTLKLFTQASGDVCMWHQTCFVNRHVLFAFIPTVNLTLLVHQQRNPSPSCLPVTFQSWHGCVWTRTVRVAIMVISRIALRKQLQGVNSLWYNIPLYCILTFFYLRGT